MPVRSWLGSSLMLRRAGGLLATGAQVTFAGGPAASRADHGVISSVGTSLFPLSDIGLGNRLHRQDLLLRQGLAIEVVGDHLGCLKPRAGRDLRAGAVLLAGLDPGNSLLEAVAADDDQLALLDTERNARGLGGLHDGGSLVVGHAVDHIEPALRRVAGEQLAGNALAEVGLPLGVFDGDDLHFRIGLHGFTEAGDAARADALLQRAGDERDLAPVAVTVLQCLQRRYTGDTAQLDMIPAREAEVEGLRAIARPRIER